MSKKPATRHYEVLDAIRTYKNDHGFSPSMRNLMTMTGISSTSVVDYYLGLLEDEGLIRRSTGISRSIEVVGGTAVTFTARKFPLKLKQSKPKVDAKKSAAGKLGKGVDAFVPRKTKKVDALQMRIDMVVAQALNNGQYDGGDVMLNRMPIFRQSRLRSVKLG
jgi:SOS-response transcriptional repressor LexA